MGYQLKDEYGIVRYLFKNTDEGGVVNVLVGGTDSFFPYRVATKLKGSIPVVLSLVI